MISDPRAHLILWFSWASGAIITKSIVYLAIDFITIKLGKLYMYLSDKHLIWQCKIQI